MQEKRLLLSVPHRSRRQGECGKKRETLPKTYGIHSMCLQRAAMASLSKRVEGHNPVLHTKGQNPQPHKPICVTTNIGSSSRKAHSATGTRTPAMAQLMCVKVLRDLPAARAAGNSGALVSLQYHEFVSFQAPSWPCSQRAATAPC
jgi:hypothetical protein